MRKDIKYNEDLESVINQLPKGGFLTVTDGERTNTMAIGWATIGVIWNKPIMMVAVRKSRFTYSIIEKSKDFTVSIPIDVDLKKELKYCGSYSGRDVDKIKDCGLTLRKSYKVNSPIIGECDRHFECKTMYSQYMNPEDLDGSIDDRFYKNDDYHMFYFGEIVDSYILKSK